MAAGNVNVRTQLEGTVSKQGQVDMAIESFTERIHNVMADWDIYRGMELKRIQAENSRLKEQLDIAVRKLIEKERIINGMKALLGRGE